jgi:hypothetical protein
VARLNRFVRWPGLRPFRAAEAGALSPDFSKPSTPLPMALTIFSFKVPCWTRVLLADLVSRRAALS